VKLHDGTRRSIQLSSESTVEDLKVSLSKVIGQPASLIFILVKGKPLLSPNAPAPSSCLCVTARKDAAKRAYSYKVEELAQFIDHTVLAANTVRSSVEKLCAEARKYNFFSVCVNSSYVKICKSLLAGSGVAVCSVVGFPLGSGTSFAKASETKSAIAAGATEIDMVVNVGRVKDGDLDYVESDIASVVKAADGILVKVILETCLLTNMEIVKVCKAAVRAGAHYVKTSTGFSTAGARLDHIALMRASVPPEIGVKASGGIRDAQSVRAFLACGATRIGASKGVQIVTSNEKTPAAESSPKAKIGYSSHFQQAKIQYCGYSRL